jgi:hypothetical protein
MDPTEPSRPPADPHLSVARGQSTRGLDVLPSERAFRVEVIAALVVGVLLIGGGVFVWRRPQAAVDAPPSEAGALAASSALGLADAAPTEVDSGAVALSDVHVIACHDRGSKRTPPDQCDRLPAVEAALSNAIEKAASCVSANSSGGTIEYVANISFRHGKVSVALPRSGRSVHDARTVDACAASVRASMQSVSLDSVNHEHTRYKLSVVATYKGTRGESSPADDREHGLNSNSARTPR